MVHIAQVQPKVVRSGLFLHPDLINFNDMPIFVMPNMLTVALLVQTLKPLTIPAHNQDGVLSATNTQRRVSILAPR